MKSEWQGHDGKKSEQKGAKRLMKAPWDPQSRPDATNRVIPS